MIVRAVKHLQGKCARQNFHTIISKEVRNALENQKPLLALESTIITHGLPHPENLLMAKSVENICRSKGVTPATLAVISGSPCIGLSNEELTELSNGSQSYIKISRRDLAPVIQQKLTGGTTVSGTMVLAHQNNIPVFATGGIGGVHRGGENTLDVSADLTELGRTPVAVVCAGVKSILDIAKTLEYLETQGVTVATYGETRDFPAFFSAKSGLLSHTNVRTPREAAEMIHVNQELNLGSGIVVAVPIPEEFAADGLEIEEAIQTALKEADHLNVVGNEITPYILKRVSELTCGRSLKTNLALVRNNVLVGSQIAFELNLIQRQSRSYKFQGSNRNDIIRSKDEMLVVGAVNVDILCTKHEDISVGKDLARGSIQHVMGGVARNVSECLARQDIKNTLISVVGEDRLGRLALESCKESGMDTSRIVLLPGAPTPVAQLLLNEGNVLEGIADFSSHSLLVRDLILEADVVRSRFAILDCDTPLDTALHVAELCDKNSVPLILEPTAPFKFKQFVDAGILQMTSILSPNATELAAIVDEDAVVPDIIRDMPLEFSQIISQMLHCLTKMSSKTEYRSVLTTLGEDGVLFCQLSRDQILQIIHLPKAPVHPHIKSTSGAGDSFLGGFLAALYQGKSVEHCLKMGTFCAFKSLESFDTISQDINCSDYATETILSWEKLGWNVNVLYDSKYNLT